MSENKTEKPAGKSETKATPQKKNDTAKAPARPRAKSGGMGFLSVLLLSLIVTLGTLAGLGYYAWLNQGYIKRYVDQAFLSDIRETALKRQMTSVDAGQQSRINDELREDILRTRQRVDMLEARFETMMAGLKPVTQPAGNDTKLTPAAEAKVQAEDKKPQVEIILAGKKQASIGDLETRLIMLAQQLEQLREQVQPGTTTEMDDAFARVNQMEEQYSQLDAKVAELEHELSGVQTKVSSLRQSDGGSNRYFSQMVAFSELQRVAESGRIYLQELEGFRVLLDEADHMENSLSTLQEHAKTGIPTERQLKQTFPPLLRKAVTMGSARETDSGIAEKTMQNLSRIITIRKVEEEGESAAAALTRAERAVEEGELQLAANELQTLPENQRQIFQDWLKQARARVAVEKALDNLYHTLIGRAQTGGAPPPASPLPAPAPPAQKENTQESGSDKEAAAKVLSGEKPPMAHKEPESAE